VLHAADRGVRVLVDDGETVAGDEQIAMEELARLKHLNRRPVRNPLNPGPARTSFSYA
jgi:hypothetical protein